MGAVALLPRAFKRAETDTAVGGRAAAGAEHVLLEAAADEAAGDAKGEGEVETDDADDTTGRTNGLDSNCWCDG